MSFPEVFPVAILAGGLATRLRPATKRLPKSLIEIAGKPFLFRQLEYLRAQRVERVVVCIGHLGAQIEAAVGDGHRFGLEVSYSADGPVPMGTGGALRRALPLLGSRFFVLYGDSYLPCDFLAVQEEFLRCGKPALMTVFRNEGRWDRSNVLYRDGCVIEYSKGAHRPDMAYIDYGLGILTDSVLIPYRENRTFDLADLYHALSLAGRLAACEVRERFYEIGSPEGLSAATEYFSSREVA